MRHQVYIVMDMEDGRRLWMREDNGFTSHPKQASKRSAGQVDLQFLADMYVGVSVVQEVRYLNACRINAATKNRQIQNCEVS